MNNIYNCCSLCLEEDKDNGNHLIWLDSMQMCEECYKQYNESEYYAKNMLINAIKKYRRKLYE